MVFVGAPPHAGRGNRTLHEAMHAGELQHGGTGDLRRGNRALREAMHAACALIDRVGTLHRDSQEGGAR